MKVLLLKTKYFIKPKLLFNKKRVNKYYKIYLLDLELKKT